MTIYPSLKMMSNSKDFSALGRRNLSPARKDLLSRSLRQSLKPHLSKSDGMLYCRLFWTLKSPVHLGWSCHPVRSPSRLSACSHENNRPAVTSQARAESCHRTELQVTFGGLTLSISQFQPLRKPVAFSPCI